MKQLLRLIALSSLILSAAAYAQITLPITLPTTCVPLVGTQPVPAPGSGSLTISNLAKYNFPAQICTGGSLSAYKYEYYAAITFNNVSYTCGGTTWKVNGGPVHVYYTGTGSYDITTASGSVNGQGYYQYDNTTVTVNNVNYQVSSGIVQGRYSNTFTGANAKSTFFVPKGGIPLTVNGQALNADANIYGCLVNDANVKIVQE